MCGGGVGEVALSPRNSRLGPDPVREGDRCGGVREDRTDDTQRLGVHREGLRHHGRHAQPQVQGAPPSNPKWNCLLFIPFICGFFSECKLSKRGKSESPLQFRRSLEGDDPCPPRTSPVLPPGGRGETGEGVQPSNKLEASSFFLAPGPLIKRPFFLLR